MAVGRQLQTIYEELLKEPMPGKIAELVRRLDEHGLVSRFLPGQTTAMTREIYRSENGDKWLLARGPGSGCAFVKHVPNVASGGRASEVEIGAFLSQRNYGPQQTELLRLIGTLVDETLLDVGSRHPSLLSDPAAGHATSAFGLTFASSIREPPTAPPQQSFLDRKAS
jgi:hypothetical protein